MPSYKVYPNVQLCRGCHLGDYAVVGEPPRGKESGELPTVIGENSIIRSHTVIYAGNRIGARFQTGHGALIREDCEIGDDVSIGSHSEILPHVWTGNGVRVHSQTIVGEYSRLEDECWVGPNVVVTNTMHPLCPKAKECMRGPTIGRGAKIGAGVILMPDITIGEMALIGAGAVVVSDVPPGAVMVGNPARQVKHISELDCPYGLVQHPYT